MQAFGIGANLRPGLRTKNACGQICHPLGGPENGAPANDRIGASATILANAT